MDNKALVLDFCGEVGLAMQTEIGSEFHRMPFETGQGIVLPRPGSFVYSGRTAIEAVLIKLPDVRSALLPSYCCDSMIEPFRAAGIDIQFYDVNWRNGLQIIVNGKADLMLWCNYFGFRNVMPEFDGMILEDCTHSFFSKKQFHEQSDYLIASLRKWEPIICGGYCSVDADGSAPPESFVERKKAAMAMKTQYLEDLDEEKKPVFLQMFAESNHWLAEHYQGLAIDADSLAYLQNVDAAEQRRIRRSNAHVLYEGLKDKVQFLFSEEDMDCPLFVPIVLKNRDAVRKYLTSNGIYCPVHWPSPKGCTSNLYDLELSLVCDQRYGSEEMLRIVDILSEAL